MAYGTLTADGLTSEFEVGSSEGGKKFHIHASGTFGGGTLSVSYECGDGTYRAIENASFTGAADRVIEIRNGVNVRASLSGATTPSLYYEFSDV